jgi:high-affinity Fe2+/Pb2+ permease
VNVQNRKSRRRRGQAMVRVVFGIGTVTAGILAYLLSDGSRPEAIVLPGIVMGLVVFGIAIHSRARSRQEWSAAWDAYAKSEVSRELHTKKYSHGRARIDRAGRPHSELLETGLLSHGDFVYSTRPTS